jgi:hypothetical protein
MNWMKVRFAPKADIRADCSTAEGDYKPVDATER